MATSIWIFARRPKRKVGFEVGKLVANSIAAINEQLRFNLRSTVIAKNNFDSTYELLYLPCRTLELRKMKDFDSINQVLYLSISILVLANANMYIIIENLMPPCQHFGT